MRAQDNGLEQNKAYVDERKPPLLHDPLGGLIGGPAVESGVSLSLLTLRFSAAWSDLSGVQLGLVRTPPSGEALGFPGMSTGIMHQAG